MSLIPAIVLLLAFGGAFNGTRACRRTCERFNAWAKALPHGDYRRLMYCECR